jgi:hypothetical protein
MSQSFRERRGAHRPRGSGPASAVPWFLAALAIVVVVGFASGWFGGSGDDDPTTPASRSTTAGATPTGKAGGAPTTPAGSPSSSRSAAPVDRTVAISVLNSTSRSGLAARAATTLRGAGWTIRATGNHRGGDGRTTVYYGRTSLRATAQAVAGDLGGPAVVQESADFGSSRVTVVLGADFQP